ncbi:hypothetical protein AtubIFM57258_002999 [Aspergillus tubingensis]|nr:hypothetical protein AtubIFM57258_002999 [Aspergillus tubingensis]
MTTESVPLAIYLFTRLRQLGVDSVFGLPGDYNLKLLDHIEPSGLRWVGNCNELNAGYAADGYARIKGLGSLVTTFGVGELSALNAIAGAYAERAPVVHIVGTPPRATQDARALVHHTFNDGEFKHFDRIQEHVTVAQAVLNDSRSAPLQIDYVLQQCLIHCRPVRIAIPDDMPGLLVSAVQLGTPVSIPVSVAQTAVEPEALDTLLGCIYGSSRPMLLVDGESRALGILDEIHAFVRKTKWPTFVTGFGRGLLTEELPNVHGVYTPKYKAFVESCDLVICFGPHYSSSNTYLGETRPPDSTVIDITATEIRTQGITFRDLPAKPFLQSLNRELDVSRICKHAPPLPGPNPLPMIQPTDPVSQKSGFWPRLSRFFQEGDIILAETGTPGYGANDFMLPRHASLFRPVTWLSIGYMLPAALGASIAARDKLQRLGSNSDTAKLRRTVILIGDGSFQLTAQEMSTIISQRLDVVIFLINNGGYTIERCIHGREQFYNSIAPWRYLRAPSMFGAPEDGEFAAHTWEIRTWADLENVLSDHRMLYGKGIRMAEVFMEKLDAPELLLGWLERQVKQDKGR